MMRFSLFLSVVLAAAIARGADSYNIIQDFSATENPSGVWSYGWKETVDGEFHLLTSPRTQADDFGNIWNIWEYQSYGVQPAFLYFPLTNPGTVTSEGGVGQYPPGTLVMATRHESTSQNFIVLRFTAPSRGLYEISAAVQSHLDGPPSGDTDFHVVDNGHILFSEFLAPVSGTSFSRQRNLSAGDTIDFVMGRGADGIEYGSALKIQAVITPVRDLPAH